jgi:type I restriction enzyme S subunit
MKWLEVELGKILEVQSGFAFKSDSFSHTEGISLIRIRDLPKSTTEIKYNGSYREEFLVRRGDYLIGMDGDFSCYIWEGEIGLLNQRVCRLTNFSSLLEPKYIYYRIQSELSQINSNTSFVTVKHISSKKIEKICIPIPPISEQRRIVEILDQADALRKMRAEADAKAERILPALFIKMFGDPAINPMGWNVVLVEKLFSKERSGTKCGPFGSALKKNEYVTHGIPVWGIDNVQPNNFIESGSLFITPSKYQELINYSVETGDILISRAGTVGRMCVARPQQSLSIISTNLIRLSLNKDEIFPEYFTSLFSYFPAAVSRLRASSDEGAYSFMNTKILKSLEIPLPPFELQIKYTMRMEQIKQMNLQKIESKDKLNNIFNVILQRAFSGELTAKWREANMKELLLEMEEQAKALNLPSQKDKEQLSLW